jgi:hypothetical protein
MTHLGSYAIDGLPSTLPARRTPLGFWHLTLGVERLLPSFEHELLVAVDANLRLVREVV